MPAEESPSLALRILLAVIVVFVAFTLVAASLIVGVDSTGEVGELALRDRDVSAEPEPPAPDPVEGAGPAPTGDAETDAVLDEIAAFVEAQRGLAFQEPVTVEVLDDAPFEERLLATFERDLEDLRTDAQALQALGFVDDVAQIEEGMRELLAAGVLGFYDPETEELVVRGADLGPLTRQTIAHELVHALDDQWFDLGKPEYEENDDEVGFGITALAEGNARRIDGIYASEMTRDERRQLDQEEMALPIPNLAAIPPVLIELINAPYDLGEVLVEQILEQGDQPALDDRFRAPPSTSEQVLDAQKLFAGEAAVPVETPPADAQATDDGMFGAHMLRLLLQQYYGGGRVNRTTEGWGGDRYVVWQQGDDYCIRIDFAMDTANDVEELRETLVDLTRELPAAQVDQPQPDRVRFTSCN